MCIWRVRHTENTINPVRGWTWICLCIISMLYSNVIMSFFFICSFLMSSPPVTRFLPSSSLSMTLFLSSVFQPFFFSLRSVLPPLIVTFTFIFLYPHSCGQPPVYLLEVVLKVFQSFTLIKITVEILSQVLQSKLNLCVCNSIKINLKILKVKVLLMLYCPFQPSIIDFKLLMH